MKRAFTKQDDTPLIIKIQKVIFVIFLEGPTGRSPGSPTGQSASASRKQHTVLNGKTSEWGAIEAGAPQGSILGPLFFLIYINDLTDGLKCNAKLFADDTSIFTVVHNPNAAAVDLNHDLSLINLWAQKW